MISLIDPLQSRNVMNLITDMLEYLLAIAFAMSILSRMTPLLSLKSTS